MRPLKPGSTRHLLFMAGSVGGTLPAPGGSRLGLLRSGSPVMFSAEALRNALGPNAPANLDDSDWWLLVKDDELRPVEP